MHMPSLAASLPYDQYFSVVTPTEHSEFLPMNTILECFRVVFKLSLYSAFITADKCCSQEGGEVEVCVEKNMHHW